MRRGVADGVLKSMDTETRIAPISNPAADPAHSVSLPLQALSWQQTATIPLCVDMDGTLIRSDTMMELVLTLLIKRPWMIFFLPFWLLKGRAVFKQRLSAMAAIPPQDFPYNAALVAHLQNASARGVPLFLVTASPLNVAQAVAGHLGLFKAVVASDVTKNLKGEGKRRTLVEMFGERGFDYAGNSAVDLHVWKSARAAVLVGPAVRYQARLRASGCDIAASFPARSSLLKNLVREIRVYQWSKNLLVFLPLLMAHKLNDVVSWWHAACGFAAFSMLASAVYVVNDLVDMHADRRHPEKRNRPFASGDLSILSGAVLELVLLAACAGFLWLSGSVQLGLILAGYAVLSTAYSFWLKHELLLDVTVLSGLYTSRVLAGGAAAQVPISTWLLGFCIFLFLSLALVKRVSEIQRHVRAGTGEPQVRGYLLEDLQTITTIGVASGCTAALVIVLYMNGQEVRVLYRHPDFLWTISPVFLYWMNQLWVKARRGLVQEDPILYCVRDKTTYLVGAAILMILIAASGYGW
jgi:4-hydroxybenzoate polyprenyltransferase/phosphoserine phosphatase